MAAGDWAATYVGSQRALDSRLQEQREAAAAERERLAANVPAIVTRIQELQRQAREAAERVHITDTSRRPE